MGSALSPAARSWAGGIAGAAALIAAVTVASRVAGFTRTVVQSDAVGATDLGTAYNTANLLPNVLFEVAAGGALAGAVVPLLAGPLARSMRSDVDRIASALLSWTLVVLVPLSGVVLVAARPLAEVLLQGAASDAQVEVTAAFLRIFAPQIPLYGVGVVLTGVLQAQRRFLAPALAPLLSSLVVIGVYVGFARLVPDPTDLGAVQDPALALLAWGTTAGVAALSLPLLWPVRRTGVRLRPSLRFPEGVAARARSLAWAGVGALLAQQVSVVVTLLMVNRHGENSLPVWNYLQAVYFLPYAVLAVPLATATFPRLAQSAAEGDRARFAQLASLTTRAVLLVAVTGAVALVASAPAVERFFVLYGTGDFTGMARALSWMGAALVGFALVFHLSRALYALERGRLAVAGAASGWLLVAGAGLVLVPVLTGGGTDQPGALLGLAVAHAAGMTVAGAALLAALARAAGRSAVAGVPRTLAVLLVGGAAGAALGRLVLGTVIDVQAADLAVVVLAGALAAALAGAAVVGVSAVADRSAVQVLVRRGGGRG